MCLSLGDGDITISFRFSLFYWTRVVSLLNDTERVRAALHNDDLVNRSWITVSALEHRVSAGSIAALVLLIFLGIVCYISFLFLLITANETDELFTKLSWEFRKILNLSTYYSYLSFRNVDWRTYVTTFHNSAYWQSANFELYTQSIRIFNAQGSVLYSKYRINQLNWTIYAIPSIYIDIFGVSYCCIDVACK